MADFLGILERLSANEVSYTPFTLESTLSLGIKPLTCAREQA